MIKTFTETAKRLCAAVIVALLVLSILIFYPVTSVSAEEAETERTRIMVSMGDSYSAGEGILKFYGQDLPFAQKITNHDWLAHRSENSWPGQLTLPGVSGTMADHKDDTWFFVAASGAETVHVSDKKQDKPYEKTDGNVTYKGTAHLDKQIDILKSLRDEGKQVDYITITMGGNDAGFSNIVSSAVMSPSSVSMLSLNSFAAKLQSVWNDFYREGGIRDNLYSVYNEILATAEGAKLIVVGYPKLFKEKDGVFITEEEAKLVNDAVSNFNKEIENIVNDLKSSGKKICFVSVEEKFGTNGVGIINSYLNGIFLTQPEDINESEFISSYSVHPNSAGAKIYADCVQDKIDSIELDNGASEWPLLTSSKTRDIVLVLDSSGSMSGDPINETKEASEKFVDTVLKEGASVGVVTYDYNAQTLTNFTMHPELLKDRINNIVSGGGTNIEAGLQRAVEMFQNSYAEKKIIVLMSDGLPNNGAVGDELLQYAEEIKNQGIYIYTLGFFSNMSGSTSSAESLMEGLASKGCHYEVKDAESLIFFFGDIADHINGQKYIYIRIACPVDVTVSYKGEKLTSKKNTTGSRASFGTLTFEENESADSSAGTSDGSNNSGGIFTDFGLGVDPDSDSDSSGTDTRVKILRLRDGSDYDIEIEGNGNGKMTYTIGFMDKNGEYSDMRKFKNIKITKDTVIETVASNATSTVLSIDQDGDGEFDLVYLADESGKARLLDNSNFYTICVIAGVSLVLLIATVILMIALKKRSKTAA